MSLRTLSVLRKSLCLSPQQSLFRNHSFCSLTKSERSPLQHLLLDDLKRHKSGVLTEFLDTLNLKKSGTKTVKIERLIQHIEGNTHRLEELTECTLKSYCNLLDIDSLEIESDEMTQNEMINALRQRFETLNVINGTTAIPMAQHPERGLISETDSNSKYVSTSELNLKQVSLSEIEMTTNQNSENSFSFQTVCILKMFK